MLEDLVTVGRWHHQIQQHHLRHVLGQVGESIRSGVCGYVGESCVRQRLAQDVPTDSVVIDDQDRLLEGHEASNVNTAPAPVRPAVGRALPSLGLLAIYGRVSRVPPHPSGGKDLPEVAEVEQLEELGDDAIIAHQQGAHAPKPRAQVTEEARSVVISDHPPVGSNPPPATPAVGQRSPRRRSERTEKTVVIRDRRQVEQLRRQAAQRSTSSRPPESDGPGLWIWIAVGVAAFVMGGLAALLATRDDEPASTPAPVPSSAPFGLASSAPAAPSEPPKVSIDELPVEDSRK